MPPPGTIFCQNFPAPEWTVAKTSDLSGKIFIATGDKTGIDKETCEELEKTGKKAIFLKLDLSDLDATKESAEEFLECVSPLSPTA